MTSLVTQAWDFYIWALAQADPRIENWPLMKTAGPMLGVCLAYMLMVYTGPRLMANRPAFNLKSIIVPYNFAMVLLSAYMFYELTASAILSNYSLVCEPVTVTYDHLPMRMATVCYWYFLSKIIETADTGFFIMRKKDNQVSFLHVYHHVTMIMCTWVGVKWAPGGQSFIICLLNSFVHIIMYAYYALAAIGPHMQKYLWWKRYLTKLQLLQFFGIMTHTIVNLCVTCDFPNIFNWLFLIHTLTMIGLFGHFYRQTYIIKAAAAKRKKDDDLYVNGSATMPTSNGTAKMAAQNGSTNMTDSNGIVNHLHQQGTSENNNLQHRSYRK